MWMERYEKDMEDKQQELNTMKNNRASNLARLQELAKQVRKNDAYILSLALKNTFNKCCMAAAKPKQHWRLLQEVIIDRRCGWMCGTGQ